MHLIGCDTDNFVIDVLYFQHVGRFKPTSSLFVMELRRHIRVLLSFALHRLVLR